MHPHGAADAQRKHQVTGLVLVQTELCSPSSICYGSLHAEYYDERKPFISKYNLFKVYPVQKHFLAY